MHACPHSHVSYQMSTRDLVLTPSSFFMLGPNDILCTNLIKSYLHRNTKMKGAVIPESNYALQIHVSVINLV